MDAALHQVGQRQPEGLAAEHPEDFVREGGAEHPLRGPVGFDDGPDLLGDQVELARASGLDLNIESDRVGNGREHIGQRGDPLAGKFRRKPAARVELLELCRGQVIDPPGVAGRAAQRGIVDDDRHLIAGQAHIQLDHLAVQLDGFLESRHRILRRVAGGASMGDHDRHDSNLT